jgi:RNA polymerase sigma-70 factor (ECF subfamily)
MKVQLKTKAIHENTGNSGTFPRAQANYHRHSVETDFEMRAESDVSDADLLRSMLAGDEDALAVLYRRRHASIYRFALQMSGSPALAEDVTQEVFMALLRDGRSYDSKRGPLNWFLLGIARNLMRQRLGREQFYAPLAEDPSDLPAAIQPQHKSDPLAELSRNQTIEAVRQAVLSLPPRYREVVVLCELQELSYVEAAGVMNCAIGTVRSRLHRARALLVEKMRSAGEENSKASRVKAARCFA